MADDIEQTDKEPILVKGEEPEYGLYFDKSEAGDGKTIAFEIKTTSTAAFEKYLKEKPFQVKIIIEKMLLGELDPESSGTYLMPHLQAYIDKYSGVLGVDGKLIDSKLENLVEDVLNEIKADVSFIARPSNETNLTDLYSIATKGARTYRTNYFGEIHGKLQSEDEVPGYITIQAKTGRGIEYGSLIDTEQMILDQRARYAFLEHYESDPKGSVAHLAVTLSKSVSRDHNDNYIISGVGRIQDLDKEPDNDIDQAIKEATIAALRHLSTDPHFPKLAEQLQEHHSKLLAKLDGTDVEQQVAQTKQTNVNYTTGMAKPNIDNLVGPQNTEPQNTVKVEVEPKATKKEFNNKSNVTTVQKPTFANADDVSTLYQSILGFQNNLEIFRNDNETLLSDSASTERYDGFLEAIKTLLNSLPTSGKTIENQLAVAQTKFDDLKASVIENKFYDNSNVWNEENKTRITDTAKLVNYKDILADAVKNGTTTQDKGILHVADNGELIFIVGVAIDTDGNGIRSEGDTAAIRAFRVDDNLDRSSNNYLAHLGNLPFSDETQASMQAALDKSTNPADGIIEKRTANGSDDSYELLHKGGKTYLVTDDFKDLNSSRYIAAEQNTPNEVLAGTTDLKDNFDNQASGTGPKKTDDLAVVDNSSPTLDNIVPKV